VIRRTVTVRPILGVHPGVILAVLDIVGLAIATYLSTVELQGGVPVCGPIHGCEEVARSQYSRIGGVPVAVMVDPTPDEAMAMATRMGAARVQLHQVDPLAWPGDFPFPVAFAIPVSDDGTLVRALPLAGPLVMLDAADPVYVGGTGHRIPWDTARVVAATRDVLLAGGLDGDSVGSALEQVRPWFDAPERRPSI